MGAGVDKMEARLKLRSSQIDELVAKTQMPGVRAGFDALMYIDELKALHAIAQSKFDEFRAAGDVGKARLKPEMESAWNELDAAFKAGNRRRRGGKSHHPRDLEGRRRLAPPLSLRGRKGGF